MLYPTDHYTYPSQLQSIILSSGLTRVLNLSKPLPSMFQTKVGPHKKTIDSRNNLNIYFKTDPTNRF
jgi:hypothetical protein